MKSRQAVITRIRFITIVILLIALVLIARLYHLQILNHETYLEQGEGQYVHKVRDIYDRGTIYFTSQTGETISAASVQAGYTLALDPSNIDDPDYTFASLSPYLNIDEDTFTYRASLPKRVYVEVATKLNQEKADQIEALNLDGVELYKQRWRYYPAGELSARTVGFVGFAGKTEGEQLVGRYGLERYHEETLTRSNDKLAVNFFAELFTNLGKLVFDNTEIRHGDVVTSIEPTVSRLLQNELSKAQDKWGSELTGGIIINPKTGEIYALDAVPTFNLNDRGTTTLQTFNNPLVESRYEMGSIIKALTMASGIDSGAVNANTTYYDAGYLELDTEKIYNYDRRGRGTVNMQVVLSQSLNTGAAFVMKTMGKEKFRDYFLKLKLGTETGIDLPGEVHGNVENLNTNRNIEYATASYGHGISFTPIATARALSALGNGGIMITPHLATKIVYENGNTKDILFPEGDRVWSEKTSEEITRMLVRVVDEALKGGTVKLPNHSIAAKTGTALLTDPEGGYYDDRYLHSFFGYFPAYDPEFLVFLYSVDPKNVTYASDTLTDPFMNIAKFLINYYNIPPDR